MATEHPHFLPEYVIDHHPAPDFNNEFVESVSADETCDELMLAAVEPEADAIRDSLLNHLRHLTQLSLEGYQEISHFAERHNLQSLLFIVEGIIPERERRLSALRDKIEFLTEDEDNNHAERLAGLSSLWRMAVHNLQQLNAAAFVDYVERSEEFLEDEHLLEATSADIHPQLAEELCDYVGTIQCARTIWDELRGRIIEEQRCLHHQMSCGFSTGDTADLTTEQ